MESKQFYSNENPNLGELVLVQFTQKNESFFDAILLEYNYRGMMNYQDATKKRKVYSWNKIVPLNKNMVARVDEVDTELKIVQLSLAYLNDNFDKEMSTDAVQKKLYEYFSENKIMEGFIKSLCIVNKYNYTTIWTHLIYHIDNLRKESNEENLSIWKFFNNNIYDIDKWVVDSGLDTSVGHAIKKLYIERTNDVVQKIISKIGIISVTGVEDIKSVLKEITQNINYKYTLKYESTPYYLFESSTEDSNVNNHQEFVKLLETTIKDCGFKIFIKCDYVGKLI
jgi:translation initiation factor 2 alpha subunit (eIF-2alpha)